MLKTFDRYTIDVDKIVAIEWVGSPDFIAEAIITFDSGEQMTFWSRRWKQESLNRAYNEFKKWHDDKVSYGGKNEEHFLDKP